VSSLELLVTVLGGVIATHELHAHGIGKLRIAALVRSGALVRIRQGWYGLPSLAPMATAAVRVGGPLCCVSAAHLRGCWLPPEAGLHVEIRRHSARLRRPADARARLRASDHVVAHWCDRDHVERLAIGIEDALRQAVRCQPLEYAIAVVDSALATREGRPPLLTRARWELIAHEFPDLAPRLREVDPRSESGTESVFRIKLLVGCGLRPRSQVTVRGVGRVDFILGRRLVVEVDSEAFHANPAQYHADRRRDALLSARGYRVLRFTYQQVLFEWPQVEAAVLGALASGDHR